MQFYKFTVFMLCSICAFGQEYIPGVRDLALARSTVASLYSDGYSINPSTPAGEWTKMISAGAVNRYGIKELNTYKIHLGVNIKKSKLFSGGYSQSGNREFKIQTLYASAAGKIGKNINTGIRATFITGRLSDSYYSASRVVIPEAGLTYTLPGNICLGVLIRNPVRVRVNTIEQPLPSFITGGISGFISKNVNLLFSISQPAGANYSLQAGIEYSIHPKVILRSGFYSNPETLCMGISFVLNRLLVEMGFTNHSPLGTISSVELIFRL